MSTKARHLWVIAGAYAVTLGAAAALATFEPFVQWTAGLAEAWSLHPSLVTAFALDVVATVVIFAFSLVLRNASTYDAYWSVAPIALAVLGTKTFGVSRICGSSVRCQVELTTR